MSEGLRERKMRLTRRRMEQAAVDLAYENGIQSVTVDQICEAAMVSRSTFFNYFPSLDDAIFGPPLTYDPALTERLLTKYSDALVIAASLIVTETLRGQLDDDIAQRRLALLSREPGATTAVSWSSDESREGLVDVVAAWLDDHREFAKIPDIDSMAEAQMIVALCISLGEEAIPQLIEEGGRLIVDEDAYRRAYRRLGQLLGVAD
ncbi:TetR/AcrR family transcriptional regulator [uncultured Microbacterium sp.]|uniref:TetR/AcrR family transcriptional regulator n=1 Tax=uncultured Microbacterium sp. TaxID=191216 RepID=UPI002626A6B8|nr:TetR/AcrR family transcriptional regulator [uncultured Microbacterium sp.]